MDKEKRKELKNKSNKRLKKHFKLYGVICLIASILGVKYVSALFILSAYNNTDMDPLDSQRTTVEFHMTNALSQMILNGRIESSTEAEIEKEFLSENQSHGDVGEEKPKVLLGHLELGDSNGVFATIYKNFLSRTFLLTMILGAYKICKSMEWALVIVVLLIIIASVFVWMFFINVYKVLMARFFLEGRIYDNIPLRRFSYLAETRSWVSAAMSTFTLAIYKLLWNMTVVGGIIKTFWSSVKLSDKIFD